MIVEHPFFNGDELMMPQAYKRPKVIGIINVTPDSFSDGGQYLQAKHVLNAIDQMILDGVDGVDIGAESSRPGATPLSLEEEMIRIQPLIPLLKPFIDAVPFSIDTTKPDLAKYCLDHGFRWVNDVSGLRHPKMLPILRDFDAGVIIMHMQKNPETMQINPKYGDIVQEIAVFLKSRALKAQRGGVKNIMIDPGLGFGKTFAHNREILQNIFALTELGWPVYVGPSRKAFIGTCTRQTPENRDKGTMAMVGYLAHQGVAAVRVHDVRGCVDTLNVWEGIYGYV